MCATPKHWIDSPEGAYHAIFEVNGVKVGVAGINTAWLCKGADDMGHLTPGKPLLEHALKSLTDCQLRLVLGHHSLDWFVQADRRKISTLLGQHSAIYLYGDQHEIWATPFSDGTGRDFLTVQGGSVFQEKEGEPWRNALLWAEADLAAGVLRLQPREWNATHQEFKLDTEAFPGDPHDHWWSYPLPGTPQAKQARALARLKKHPPAGWSVVQPDTLRGFEAPLSAEQAVAFFNGAVPDWRTALSSSIPRRRIVSRLTSQFMDRIAGEPPRIVLLLAAGCEGKSTALLQAADQITKDDPRWTLLVRDDATQPFNPDALRPMLSCGEQWLVVIDEADSAAGGLSRLLAQHDDRIEGKVHFLLSARDSDWHSSEAHRLRWPSKMRIEKLPALEPGEAHDIVESWGKFGDAGLGRLKDTEAVDRAEELLKAARKEASGGDGAFFGALLTVRFDHQQLQEHARVMLERLKSRQIPSGGTLFDALVLIAAMHAENLLFLERPILAEALQCPRKNLQRDVLQPLGREAVTTTSDFIFTRHVKIALAIMNVAESSFGEERDEHYLRVSRAAIDVANAPSIHTRENPARWRYELPEHFFNSGRKRLGVEIAESVLSREPEDYKTLLKMAQLYRKFDASEEAARLFREFPAAAPRDRAFYSEWGTTEGNGGDYYADFWLNAYSLSDQNGHELINRLRAELSLVGCCLSLEKLHRDTLNPVFLSTCVAGAVLGMALAPTPRTAQNYRQCLDYCQGARATMPSLTAARDGICLLFERAEAAVRLSAVHERPLGTIQLSLNLTFKQFDGFIRAASL